MRHVLLLALCTTTAVAEPREKWLPWGLGDRVQVAPPRASITTEWSSRTPDAVMTTLHAQASTECDCRAGIYGTLPIVVSLAQPIDTAAAASTSLSDPARVAFATADIGVFISAPHNRYVDTTYRLGALLPTASNGLPAMVGARAQDMVLELPRSAGARFSTSHLFGFFSHRALRVDTGLSIAHELDALPGQRSLHLVPHVALGMLFARERSTLSVDTVVAMDPTDRSDMNVRWSTGVTGRLVRTDGDGARWQPAITLAAVRTPEGWGGSLAIDLAISGSRSERYRNRY